MGVTMDEICMILNLMLRDNPSVVNSAVKSFRSRPHIQDVLPFCDNRFIGDNNGSIGLLGILNALLGAGEFRLAVIYSEDGNIDAFLVIDMRETYEDLA